MEALNARTLSVLSSFSTPPSTRNRSRPYFFTNSWKPSSSSPNSNSLKSHFHCNTPAAPPALFQCIKDLAFLRKLNPRPGGSMELDGQVLQSGGIGMALLSTTTAAARVHISPFIATLAANPTFVSGLLAWALAQTMKVFLNFFLERKWDLRILFSSGGMPSSHSALCTALTTSVAICHGVRDSLFPVCLGFSLIVMYDATGVRRHAGMQAEVLNLIIEDLFQWHPISQRKLKELLGHTPSQVFAGALLGILVACFCCQSCLVAA